MRRRHQPKPGWNDETDSMQPAPTPAQIDKQIDEATKEVTDTVGMGGSLGRVRSGGVGIKTGAGMEAIVGGVRKTTIEPDGDFFVGSDIDDPAGLSFAVFTTAQNWNGEDMEEGDALFGDNSEGSSNIKWDASEGQWQFRVGTTVTVYMDTDGKILFGGGDGWLDQFGLTFANQEGRLSFLDTGSGDTIALYSDGDNFLVIENSFGDKGVTMLIDDAAHNVTQIDFKADGIHLFDGNVDIPAGQTYDINGSPHAHTYTETLGTFLNSGTIPASTTHYTCPWKDVTNTTQNQFPWIEAGTLKNLMYRVSGTQDASGSLVLTLVKNGVDTALTVTVPAGSGVGTYSDTTHTVAIASGDLLMWKIVNNATAASMLQTAISMQLEKST
jgi:hypothetical protein